MTHTGFAAPERGSTILQVVGRVGEAIIPGEPQKGRRSRLSAVGGPISQPQRKRVKKSSVKKEKKNEKRHCDSLEDGTFQATRNSERFDVYQVEFGVKFVALCQFYGVGSCAGLFPMTPFAEFNSGGVFSLLGIDVHNFGDGSTDTNCGDGEEGCEEVFREQHRCRRNAKIDMRGR